ncbi:MAG TPA: NAD(P)-dependent alcohol dehydrogenase [Candidatus Dormibacteraeota bacterium]
MKAVVYDHYGPPEVLRLAEVDKPTPKHDELLVKVQASTVNRLDCHTREANRSNGPLISLASRLVSGPRRPRQPILGSEFAGVVEATGPAVTEFKAGDRVFGNTGLALGCHAEYICLRAGARVARMAGNASFEEAATVTDGAYNALWCLRQAETGPGTRLLVYGASGAIGTAAVQLARHFGADVTAVCSTKNLDLMKSLGADRVIDYTREDFTKNGETYDVIFDAVGKHSFVRCRDSLKRGGCYLPTDGLSNLWWALWTAGFENRKVKFRLPPRYLRDDLALMRELMEAGKYRAVIDRRYPMEDVVEAARYVETQQKTGNVVLAVSP